MAAEQNNDAERAADLAAFAKWKGYELPVLNNHGQFHQDWLHREFVAFCAGRRRSAAIGEGGLLQAAQSVKTWQERCGITRKPEGQVERAMEAEITDLRAQLAHKTESARRWESKLDAVWADLCRVIEKHTGQPVDGEPFDTLDALLARQSQDAHDAKSYRLLRDAEKVPPAVWDALEMGDGLDHAMDQWIALTSPIPFCEPCKAGRYSECHYAIPCTIPAPSAAPPLSSEQQAAPETAGQAQNCRSTEKVQVMQAEKGENNVG